MKSDRGALSTVKDALGLGAATIDVAYTGMNSAIDVTKEIKNKLVAARQPGIDRGKVQSEIAELQNQLQSIADSSVFSGEHWLSVVSRTSDYNGNKNMIASFSRSGGSVSVGTISIDVDSVKLYDGNDQSGILDSQDTTTNGSVDYSVSDLDISSFSDTDDDLQDLEQMIGYVDEAIGSMTTAASNLGAIKQRTKTQSDFVSALMTAIDTGVGALVDADMNEESTKLQALQVQQQLGIQALSIANQNSQMVLSLFR